MVATMSKARSLALRMLGAFFALAAFYHASVIFWPSWGDHGSPLRHGVFVAIDGGVAVGLFRRPPFFFWLFTALGLQQLHSHGSAFVHELWIAHRIDGQSLLVLLIIPVTWWLLLADVRQKRSTVR